MSIRLSALSREYLRMSVSASEAGSPVVPTSDAVSFAFMTTAKAQPGASDWKAGTWETDATTTPATYYARILLGPSGTVTLATGTYYVWIRVTDNPEQPVRRVTELVVE